MSNKKLTTMKPRKETVRIHAAELEQCGGKKKSTRVEIVPDRSPRMIFATVNGKSGWHQVDKRGVPIVPVWPPSRHKRLAIILAVLLAITLATFAGYAYRVSETAKEKDATIDLLIPALEDATKEIERLHQTILKPKPKPKAGAYFRPGDIAV